MIGHERGREFADALHVERAEGAADGIGDDARVGVDGPHGLVPGLPQVEEPVLVPEDVGAARRVLRAGAARQIEAGRGLEVLLAMLAPALAVTVPAVDEDAVHAVGRHDLALHLGHKLEVVRPEPAGDPHLGRGPVAARLAVGGHRDPVGMGGLHIVIGGVRVGARDDDHAELAAAGDEFAEHIAVAQPGAAMVEGNLGRVIRHAAAGAEADGVRLGAREVIEPELQVELARVVLDERQLGPAHGLVDPRRRGRDGAGHGCVRAERGAERKLADADGRAGHGRGLEEMAAAEIGHRGMG